MFSRKKITELKRNEITRKERRFDLGLNPGLSGHWWTVVEKPRIVCFFSVKNRNIAEFSLFYASNSSLRRKDSGRSLTKNVKFLRAPSLKGTRSLGGKIQQLETKRKLNQPVKTSPQEFEAKERKKKRELCIQIPYWYFCKKFFFVMYNFSLFRFNVL